jgi:hypothetical protein
MSLSKPFLETTKIEKLEEIVIQFKQKYDIDFYFCEIIGARWSFVAGDAHSYLPQKRVVINDTLGMLIDDSVVGEKDLENIIDIIRVKIST